MAKKDFSMAFLIGAQLKGSFGNTFSNVLKTFSETNAVTEKNKKVLNSLTDAYKSGTIATQTFQRNLVSQSLGVFSARLAKTKGSFEVFNSSFGVMTAIAAPLVSFLLSLALRVFFRFALCFSQLHCQCRKFIIT